MPNTLVWNLGSVSVRSLDEKQNLSSSLSFCHRLSVPLRVFLMMSHISESQTVLELCLLWFGWVVLAKTLPVRMWSWVKLMARVPKTVQWIHLLYLVYYCSLKVNSEVSPPFTWSVWCASPCRWGADLPGPPYHPACSGAHWGQPGARRLLPLPAPTLPHAHLRTGPLHRRGKHIVHSMQPAGCAQQELWSLLCAE